MQENLATLDPDELINEAHVHTDANAVPTGAGLSKRECKKLLVQEMNKLIQKSNGSRLRRSQVELELVAQGMRKRKPFPLYLISPFSGLRNINEVVFMARQRGGYEELLENAGFRPRR